MYRWRLALVAGILGGFAAGCGEDQPNRPPAPNEVTPEYTKNTLDMMKKANSGMDPKNAKAANAPPKE